MENKEQNKNDRQKEQGEYRYNEKKRTRAKFWMLVTGIGAVANLIGAIGANASSDAGTLVIAMCLFPVFAVAFFIFASIAFEKKPDRDK